MPVAAPWHNLFTQGCFSVFVCGTMLSLWEIAISEQEKNDSAHNYLIIFFQALLMDAGSSTFKAIKQGELEGILAVFVALAYAALKPLAAQDKDLGENKR